MVSILAIITERGKKVEFKLEKWFIASEDPLYLGIIAKPSPGIWEHLSHSKEVVMEIEGQAYDFRVPYRIEVGENSIFFMTPADQSIKLSIPS